MLLSRRVGVFETNSSSVHAIVCMSDSEYERWQRGRFIRIPRYERTPCDVTINDPVIVDKWVADEDTRDVWYADEDDPNKYISKNYIPSDVSDNPAYYSIDYATTRAVTSEGEDAVVYVLDLEYKQELG